MKPNLTTLAERAALLRQLRSFFDERGFLEVQPPCLSRDCVVDAYLDPISIDTDRMALATDGSPQQYHLQTSPESAMKRMLAAGAPSIYSLGPVFRAGERGDWHNTEFTMLEWYEVGGDLNSGVRLLGQLACQVLGHESFDTRTYRQVFLETTGVDPIDADLRSIQGVAESIDAGLTGSIAEDRDAMLDLVLSRRVQPSLGLDRPLVVTHYPISQAALAKPAPDDGACAARFELFHGGVEVANGYDELLDADVLVARYEANNVRRIAAGRSPLPTETSLVAAMRDGLPPCSGVALGVDRLLMCQQRKGRIEEVIPLVIEKA